MVSERANRESVVQLGASQSVTASGAARIAICWALFVVGVVFVPALLVFWALVISGPIEYSGARPPVSEGSLDSVWVARIIATAAALSVLAITITVTARGGRLINGWVVLVLSAPVVYGLWALQLG